MRALELIFLVLVAITADSAGAVSGHAKTQI